MGPLQMVPFIAIASSLSSGSNSAGSRFQSLMAGAGGSGANKGSVLKLPSQRGLASEHPAPAGKTGEEEDPLRGWHRLPLDPRALSLEPLPSLLYVSVAIKDGRSGIMVLLDGTVPVMLIPLPEPNNASSLQDVVAIRHDGELLHLISISRTATEEDKLRLQSHQAQAAVFFEQSSLSTLYQIILLSSGLRGPIARALDIVYLLTYLYKSLKSSTAESQSSLSAQQAAALPPLSRLHYIFDELETSHIQSIKNHLVTALCIGISSEMIETLLLNGLSDGKWKTIYENITRSYEGMEVLASELGRVLDDVGRRLRELQGWAAWQERCGTILPQEIEGVRIQDHLTKQMAALSSLRSTSHQVLHYLQGERLAWEEANRWILWETERLEAIHSEAEEVAERCRSFDPLVVVELVQRGFESHELEWLILESKKLPKWIVEADKETTEDVSEAKLDDSEASFVRPNANGQAEDESIAIPAESTGVDIQPDSADGDHKIDIPGSQASAPSLQTRLKERLSWLEEEDQSSSSTALKQATSTGGVASSDPPRLFAPGPATTIKERSLRRSIYTKTPVKSQLRSLVLGVKSVFLDLPERMQSLAEVTLDSELDIAVGSREAETHSSIPIVSWATLEAAKQHSSVADRSADIQMVIDEAAGQQYRLMLVHSPNSSKQRVTLIRQRVNSQNDDKAATEKAHVETQPDTVEVDLPVENVIACQLLDDEKLVVLHGSPSNDGQSESSTASAMSLTCFFIPSLLDSSNATSGELSGSSHHKWTVSDETMQNALLFRQVVPTDEVGPSTVTSYDLAVSAKRNVGAVLQRHKTATSSSSAASTSTTESEKTQGSTSSTQIEFWDLEPAVVGEEEDETMA